MCRNISTVGLCRKGNLANLELGKIDVKRERARIYGADNGFYLTVVITVGYYVLEYMNCGVGGQIGAIIGISVVITFALVELAKWIPGLNGMLGMKR